MNSIPALQNFPNSKVRHPSASVQSSASNRYSGRGESMSLSEFEIELTPSSGELRPLRNIPPGSPNRRTITEDENEHTVLKTSLVQVQYGTYDRRPACLLVIQFRFKFREGVHRLKTVKITIELKPVLTSDDSSLVPDDTIQRLTVVKIAPVILFTPPLYERIETKHGTANSDTHQTEAYFSPDKMSRYASKLQGKIEGIITGVDGADDSIVTWDVTEAAKIKDGVIPIFRGAMLIQFPGEDIHAHFTVDGKEGMKKSFLWNYGSVNGSRNEPLILNSRVSFGPQISLTLDEIDLEELVKPSVLLPSMNLYLNKDDASVSGKSVTIPPSVHKTGNRKLRNEDYKVAWICAIYKEVTAAITMLDGARHNNLPKDPQDDNSYILGCVNGHNVVIASLPDGEFGTNSAARVASHLKRSFPGVRFSLMVGIGGGVPSCDPKKDIRLGDIVVSRPTKQHGGVLQYDMGKQLPEGLEMSAFLNAPPVVLRTCITTLRGEHAIPGNSKITDYLSPQKNPKLPSNFTVPTDPDLLFKPDYIHVDDSETCAACDHSQILHRPKRNEPGPVVHYGTIGSGNTVMKNGIMRDKLAKKYGIICFEMEAAGLMNAFPCVVIRGISDYSDSHKNSQWQNYAAIAAAAFAKELLRYIPSDEATKTSIVEP